MLNLLNEKFYGKYDFFYLPMDLKTKYNVGFAFINMLHPLYILDFYLEFNAMKWNEKVAECNSQKYCEIMYANMQGLTEIKKELNDKNIMKKNDANIKPIMIDNIFLDENDLIEVKQRCTKNKEFIDYFKQKLNRFSELKNEMQTQQRKRPWHDKKKKGGDRNVKN
jgi:hypothetical protein